MEKDKASEWRRMKAQVEKDEGPSGELKLAKYRLKAQVEKYEGSSGEE